MGNYIKLVEDASRIAQSEEKSELDQLSIKNTVQSFLLEKLAKFSINEGHKAIVIFNKSSQVGFGFDIDVIHRLFCNAIYTNSVRKEVAVYLTTVKDYLTIEFFDPFGNFTKDIEIENIGPDFINAAINNDMELRELFIYLFVSVFSIFIIRNCRGFLKVSNFAGRTQKLFKIAEIWIIQVEYYDIK